MIRKLEVNDLDACAQLLMDVYNNELWQCRWDMATAKAYLMDYVKSEKFVGYVKVIDDKVCGAIFCHEKIWWNNNEIFVDEMFILPSLQGKGYGTELLKTVEAYIKDNKLAGFTLLTNHYSPAPKFYKKNGFELSEPIIMMYKNVE